MCSAQFHWSILLVCVGLPVPHHPLLMYPVWFRRSMNCAGLQWSALVSLRCIACTVGPCVGSKKLRPPSPWGSSTQILCSGNPKQSQQKQRQEPWSDWQEPGKSSLSTQRQSWTPGFTKCMTVWPMQMSTHKVWVY